MLMKAPLLALGTIDEQGRPWSTVWGGNTPFAQPLGGNMVGVKTIIDTKFDPVAEILFKGSDSAGKVELSGDDMRMVSGLTIDLETRTRVKLFGKMMAGLLAPDQGPAGEATLVVKIEESLGNCPKYLNKKQIKSVQPDPKLLSESIQLDDRARTAVEKADLFFISSSHGSKAMDTNHRGGPAGFIRIVSNEASGAVITWPEYSGNRLYQTLGNLQTTPRAGLAIPNFETGDVLYVTGTTEILVGQDAAALLPRSNLAVKLNITAARLVGSGLPFRGASGEPSPYNPNIRYASTEKKTPGVSIEGKPKHTAVLIGKTEVTATISRFRFSIENPGAIPAWKPGQYASLSFADELDMGYSHMNDSDPLSLNDDFVRTFTVSSPPSKASQENGTCDDEFEMTIRNVGTVTQHLFRQNPRAGLEIPLNGFEGEFKFEQNGDSILPMIAAGVGITPVLGQLDYLDLRNLRLIWTVAVKDIGLVTDTMKRYPALAPQTQLFVTGIKDDLDDKSKATLEVAEAMVLVSKALQRRVTKDDIDELDAQIGEPEKWYLCVGPSLKPHLLQWLAGKQLHYEDFNY